MNRRLSAGDKIFNVVNAIFLTLVIVISIYPMWYVLVASFSNSSRLMTHDGILVLPQGFNIASYQGVFRNANIAQGYKNTLFILTVGLTINIFLTCFGAYFLSLKDVMFKQIILVMIVITMYFSGGIVPLYLTIRNIGLYDSIWSVILSVSVSTFNLIILRTAFSSLPSALIESAEIDGANDFVMLFKIFIPLSMSTIAVILLYYGVSHWNSWFNASLFLSDRTLYPLQLVLREILIQNDTNLMSQGAGLGDRNEIAETLKYATIIVTTVPILCVYPFLQRYFEKGMMIGALKG